MALFGPTAWGVRGLSIVAGLGMVILMYYLGKTLVHEKVGLVAAFFTAISPWSMALSRGGFEAHFALFLATLGIIFLLKTKENPWNFLGFIVSWGLVIHTYSTFKLTLPLLLIVLILNLILKEDLFSQMILEEIQYPH